MLDEANVGGLLTEALTADVEAVLADQTGAVGADAARASALAVLAGAGVPDGFVRHVGEMCGDLMTGFLVVFCSCRTLLADVGCWRSSGQ